MTVIIEQQGLNKAELYEVKKVGYDWCFKIPTQGGIMGQVVTNKTKKQACLMAKRWYAANNTMNMVDIKPFMEGDFQSRFK